VIDQLTHIGLNQAKFDSWADTYEDKRYDFFRRMQERVLGLLGLTEGMSLLDIGCGTGWAVRRAASIAGTSGWACGIDFSAKMIENARKAAERIKNAEFQQANSEELPFADQFFDRVMCTMSFHHYLHPAKAMSEIARVLKPAGKVCTVDPTSDNIFMRWADWYIRRKEPDHVNMYSSKEFEELFRGAGLRYIESSRIMFLWFTAKAHTAQRG
jgi:ubiquinone/menaquinone biosynthesis C-methylase UbiE